MENIFPFHKILLFCDFENWCTNAFEMLISFYLCHFLPNFLWMNCISMCLFNMNIFCNIVCIMNFISNFSGTIAEQRTFLLLHCAWGKCDLGKNMRQFENLIKGEHEDEKPKILKTTPKGNKCGFTWMWWDIFWRYSFVDYGFEFFWYFVYFLDSVGFAVATRKFRNLLDMPLVKVFGFSHPNFNLEVKSSLAMPLSLTPKNPSLYIFDRSYQ